jgi:hypothetical protein
MTVVTDPTLHQLLEQDAAALVRLLIASLPANLRLPAGALLRAQGWDWSATSPVVPPLAHLSARNLEVLTAALAHHLGRRLVQAGAARTWEGGQPPDDYPWEYPTYTQAEVDRALAALADVLGR